MRTTSRRVFSADARGLVRGPGDVGVQVADRLFLFGNDAVHQVANGDDAYNGPLFHDGKMPEVLVGNDAQALTNRVLPGYGEDGAAHDCRDGSVFGVVALRSEEHTSELQS